jgi:ferredoxin-NADP reductase
MEASFTQWWRDAVHTSRRLRGVLPPPVKLTLMTPSAASRATHAPEPTHGRVAIVREVIRRTRDAVSLVLAVEGEPLRIEAGQFVTLSVVVLGKTHRRNYSVSSPQPGPSREQGRGLVSEIELTVKRVAGGIVSSHLVTRASVGDRLRIEGPHGAFVRRPGHRGPLVMIAGGSGITPVYSIITTVLAENPGARIDLVYGNRTTDSVIFGGELARLAAAHDGLRVHHVTGPLDEATLHRVLAGVESLAEEDTHVFICGPSAVRKGARAVLAARGVDGTRVLEERYTQDASPADARATEAHVELRSQNGARTQLTLAPGETLLAGALRAGLAAPFSCTMGGCGECKMKLVSGAVVQEEPNCLLPAEKAAGYVLGCVAHPKDGCVVEVRS